MDVEKKKMDRAHSGRSGDTRPAAPASSRWIGDVLAARSFAPRAAINNPRGRGQLAAAAAGAAISCESRPAVRARRRDGYLIKADFAVRDNDRGGERMQGVVAH